MGTIDARRIAIGTRVQISGADILEIGALDSPTFPRPEHRVWFADFTDTEDLARKGDKNPRYERSRLVHVDYPIRGCRYRDVVDRRFDLIVANHVIEHVPDVITWLDDLGGLLRSGGQVFLSVPDRRYTFDILRRESNLVDLLRAHEARKSKPDFGDLFDHLWHYRPVKASEIWAGTHGAKLAHPRMSPTETLREARRQAAGDYHDVHCHVFTQNSFAALLEQLRELGLLGFSQLSVGSVARNTNEFHVFLSGYEPLADERPR
jgi:SAM-dependent methyltransferase